MRRFLALVLVGGLTASAWGSVLVAVPAHAAVSCDKRVSAPADLQNALNAAGTGKVVCLSGTFGTKVEIRTLGGQTIVGGVLKYTGAYNVCKSCNLTNGYRLATNSTLRDVEVVGFEGRGVVMGSHSAVIGSYIHDNRQNGIYGFGNGADTWLEIRNNRIIHNGSVVLEGNSAAGIKLLELSKTTHALGAGATVVGNTVSNNYGNGIWFDRSSNAVIAEQNIANDNRRHGIRCEICGGPVRIANNTTKGNGFDGIDVTSTGVAVLASNVSSGNGDYEITVHMDGRAKKNYPENGNVSVGWRLKDIVISGTSKVTGQIQGCGTANVRCSK